jgi:hypothetical protein
MYRELLAKSPEMETARVLLAKALQGGAQARSGSAMPGFATYFGKDQMIVCSQQVYDLGDVGVEILRRSLSDRRRRTE